MKRGMWWAVLLALGWVSGVEAGPISTLLNQAIPDGDPAGLASTIHMGGESGWVGSLQVDLNIGGTYTGDLYAYLVHGGGFSILLNRPGRTASDSLGYGDGGLNVTFADGAANGDIHNYRSTLFGNASTPLSGPLTGTWSPDGRQSSPFAVTDADARTALLSSFDGLDPNGDWTLFVADLSGGDLHQLNSWGLELGPVAATVPDTGSTAGVLLIGLAALVGGILKAGPSSKYRVGGRAGPPWLPKWPIVSSAVLILTVAWTAAGEGGSGGRLTGWGGDNVFPINAYGATFTKIAAGGSYCLALKVDGTVVAWGVNYSGQCEVPAGLQGGVEIAAGDSHSLALRMDGTVVAWGDSYYGQCEVPAGLQGVVKIAAGNYHSLALRADGTLAAWGVFYGHPSALWDEPVPCVVPSGLSNVVAIAAGGTQCMALKSDGTVVAWGLVVDVPFAPLCAVTVPDGLTGVVGIAVGAGHCLAVKEDGTVAAWTSCGGGEYDVPSGLTNVIAIAAAVHNLALKGDGTVVAWGDNWAGKCDVPAGLDRVVAISAGGCESLVVREDGSLVVWGDNSMGRDMPLSPTGVVAFADSGKGPIVLKEDGTVAGPPEPPPGLEGVVAVAAGESGYCQALKRDGTVVAWGDNEFGQCDVPQGLTGVVGIAAGGAHGLALRENGTVVAWGNNSIGQCDVPAGLNEVVAIAAGDAHSLALKADGTVVAWGNNFEGQCDVPGKLTDVVAITGAANHSLALKSNGTVVGWGDDYFGQPDMPTAFGGLVAISTGVGHSVGLRADGTVIAWGADWTRAFDVPSGLSGVTAISAGAGDTWALFGGPTNRPPLAQDYALEAASNSVAILRLFALHAVCSDPDRDSFIVTGVGASSAAGGTAKIVDGAVVYMPPKDFVGSDSFTYTMRDSRGGVAQGTIHVTVAGVADGGGRVTGWGTERVFPLDASGALFARIAVGGWHCLAVTTEGTVVAWGETLVGACDVPSGLNGVTAVAAGENHSLALKSNGTVVAWGGFYEDAPRGASVAPPSGLTHVVAVSAGGGQSFALRSDGTVVGWGWIPRLGGGWTNWDDQFAPVTVPDGLSGVVAIAAGHEHGLALKSDGTVVAWGNNSSGQCNVPSGTTDVVSIAAGHAHSLALKRDGTIVAWGSNGNGECNVPRGLSGVVALAAGSSSSLALNADGTVVAWGLEEYGGCDVPSGLNGVVGIAAAGFQSLALTADGVVVPWGGLSDGVDAPVPPTGVVGVALTSNRCLLLRDDGTVAGWLEPPPGLSNVVAVAAGLGHALALKNNGTVEAWGADDFGQCDVPSGLEGAVAVAAGMEHSLALKADGTVVAWGYNGNGQCNVPTGLREVVAISGAWKQSLALKADGTVLAWGDDTYCACDVPAGLTGVVAIAAGDFHNLALKVDGTVVAWGRNGYGQCDVPAGLDRVLQIAAGNSHSLALQADGTIAAWGHHDAEECDVPSGLAGVTALFARGGESMALFGGAANRPPVATDSQLQVTRGTEASLPLFKLHRLCSDPDWDSFIITDVSASSAAGGWARISGSSVIYTPPAGFVGSDSFTYTVRDCRGATAQGTVNVTVSASFGSGANILGVSLQPGGAATIRFAGIPGQLYSLEASSDLMTWQFVVSATAGPTGLLQFSDPEAASYSTRYYRTRYGGRANP